MKGRFLFILGLIFWGSCGICAAGRGTSELDELVKVFEQNPGNPESTLRLLKELDRAGKPGQEVIDRYFLTQKEADYCKEYNWIIVRDFVNDINAPQLKYVFEHQDKFIQYFSKDDVFQKLDNVLVNHLDKLYQQNKTDYEKMLQQIKDYGYVAYITASSVTDIFYIIRKETHDISRTYVIMENIFQLVSVLSVTEKDIRDAFGQKWKDFEDCVQYMTGKNSNMDYIITVNGKDYADAMLPVMTPAVWIEKAAFIEE